MADRKFHHVLISFSYTYEGEGRIPSRQISNYLAQAMPDQDGRHLERITTYSMPYAITPIDCGLKEQWSKLTPEEIELLGESHPDLVTAIALMCGDDDERQPGTAKDSSTGKN